MLNIAYKPESRSFLIVLRKNAKKWTFLKIDPGNGINLGYLSNPPP